MTCRGSRLALFVFVFFLLVSCRPETPETASTLAPGGGEVEREIAVGESHVYAVPLTSGDFLALSVEQRGVDVTITFDSGRESVEYDRPNRLHGPEEAPFVATATETHRVVVRAIEGRGAYRLRHAATRPAGDEERRCDATARALAAARQARETGGAEGHRRAAGAFARAVFEARREGDDYAAAMAWRELARTRVLQSRPSVALGAYREARQLAVELGDARQEIDLGNLESSLLLRLGEPRQAVESARLALALARELGDDHGAAVALNNSAIGRRQSGDAEAALGDEAAAVELWEKLAAPRRLALTLRNLGSGYLALGREEEALDVLERARELYRQTGAEAGEALASAFIGQALARRGDEAAARVELEAARVAQERLGDPYAEAVTLSRLAEVAAGSGDLPAAETAWERAIELYAAAGDPLRRAWAETGREWWRLMADPASVSVWQERRGTVVDAALELFRQRQDPAGEAFALLVRARGRAAAGSPIGRLSDAARDAEAALEIFESLRAKAGVPAHRRSLLASRHAFYETLIAVLMKLDEEQPGAGHAERAFAVSERSRSRVLLDHLAAGPPLELGEIRQRLFDAPADAASLLLEFHLGTERGFLFVIGRDLFRVEALPGRAAIEDRARTLHDLLARRDRALAEDQARLAAVELGGLLLGRVGAELASAERLLIAADGALHYLPFATLVVGERRLIEDHEIVHLPSASVLVHQRRQLAVRTPAPLTLAMIADPVYESGSDPPSAFGLPASSRDLVRAADEVGLEAFVRLPGARREAEAALALVPAAESLRALGPEATRDVVLSGALGRYRVVHFAAHGFSNVRRPELSGLALSLRDAAGRPRDGFLRARDVEGLDLPAELVVLSACRTGLGKEERGAGLVGLPQSFFVAGARRVMVSLWSVGDESTARLMEPFYAALLKDGRRPAEALRRAQLALLESGESSPHAWAPFVLIGDWR